MKIKTLRGKSTFYLLQHLNSALEGDFRHHERFLFRMLRPIHWIFGFALALKAFCSLVDIVSLMFARGSVYTSSV